MARQRTPHTSCARGKRVRVVLRTGETFVDKFMAKTSREIVFAQRRVARGEIRAFTIWKHGS